MAFTPADVTARQILDSRGNPTVEVDVRLQTGAFGRAAVPSGASTGSHEAVELRDGGDDWNGKGVATAVANVTSQIADAVCGTRFETVRELDDALRELDGTPNKGRLGANALLGVSLAAARACADDDGLPLWSWLAHEQQTDPLLPVPMLNIINGGEHANNRLDVQEFMVVPHGFATFGEALRAGVATFQTLRRLLDERGFPTAVGDEGGFAPDLDGNEQALELIVQAIEQAGYEPGDQISLALDVAATELHRDGRYQFASERRTFDASQLADTYELWLDRFPLVSIEDGMSEDDWGGWRELTSRLGGSVQLVGDDLFVTNPQRLQQGIDDNVANAMLVKVNQIGTLSETLEAMQLARSASYANVMSHRSGETEDAIIADLAVGTACGQIKTGAPSRSDRVSKYNQLLRIEEQLGDRAAYATPFAIGSGV